MVYALILWRVLNVCVGLGANARNLWEVENFMICNHPKREFNFNDGSRYIVCFKCGVSQCLKQPDKRYVEIDITNSVKAAKYPLMVIAQ